MIYGPLSEVLLDGRYRVGEVIGSGGFGTVYAAIHLGLEARVAIKVPRIDDLAPSSIPAAIATFLDEGRTLKLLRHPSLVAALDVSLLPPDERGLALPYLVLEWCEGPTLKAWRATRPGMIPAAEAWELLRPAFLGIAHAHEEGVAHRDIKPANILLETSRDGALIPRVIDFGIAKILGPGEQGSSGATRTTSELRAFTPKYAAPEQLTGLRSGPQSDVYALALVLLEVIRGEPVFASDDEARRAVLDADFPTPRKLGLDLGHWNEHVERALSPRPSDRFADAGAFARALDGGEIVARPTPIPRVTPAPAPPAQQTPAPPRERTAAAGDESVVPSSHTLRTLGTLRLPSISASPPRLAIILGSGAALLFAAFVVLIMVGAGGFAAAKRMQVRPASASAAASSNQPAPPPTAAATMRPLMSLSGTELRQRAEAGGLTRCKTSAESKVAVQIDCLEGHLTLADHGNALPPVHNRVWRMMQTTARVIAVGGRVARFTVDGDVGISFAAPPAIIDTVVARVLDGTRHEEIGEMVGRQDPPSIPARLSEWKGPELGARIRAIGGNVQAETPGIAVLTVLYTQDDKDAFAAIGDGNVKSFVESTSGPYAFAVDGDVAIVIKGDGDLGRIAHLKRILGTTTATRIAEHR